MKTNWSKKYEKCQECGTIKIKHQAFGLCRTCYTRLQRKEDRKNEGCNDRNLKRDKYFFGGHRAEHLKNNPHCINCGNIEDLVVHHRSGRRRNKDPKDFQTLCRSCHGKLHKFLKLKKDLKIFLNNRE